ncbi:MAG: hypothetical protein IJW55_05255 [Clostridia bacterium]|nr:hypothetical protein [Clostridia bacterium]
MSDFRKPRIVGRIVKGLLGLFVLFVNVLILWRVFFSASIPDTVKPLTVNEHLATAYEQYGDRLTLQYQNQKSLTYATDNAGYFGIPEYVFIPEANQVQIVFRYNKSTLDHLAEDYGLAEVPEKSGEWFDVTLVKSIDLTPDNRDDNLDVSTISTVRYQPTASTREDTSLYTYYRFVFDGVVLEDEALGVFVDVYYKGDLDYTKEAYGTLCLYDDLSEWLDYNLSSADRKALKAATAQ